MPAPEPSMKRVRPEGLFGGVPYAYGTVVTAGTTLFTAGACPLDAGGATVAAGDFEAQARQAVANLFTVLAEAGASPADVIKSTVYVATSDRQELVRVWSVVKEELGVEDPPSTLVGVAALGWPDQLVEIEAVALVPGNINA
jgi:enamine deaminase RidA (YjgF/YER057c/UK114 family)